jgi:hypothetical protein
MLIDQLINCFHDYYGFKINAIDQIHDYDYYSYIMNISSYSFDRDHHIIPHISQKTKHLEEAQWNDETPISKVISFILNGLYNEVRQSNQSIINQIQLQLKFPTLMDFYVNLFSTFLYVSHSKERIEMPFILMHQSYYQFIRSQINSSFDSFFSLFHLACEDELNDYFMYWHPNQIEFVYQYKTLNYNGKIYHRLKYCFIGIENILYFNPFEKNYVSYLETYQSDLIKYNLYPQVPTTANSLSILL